MDQINVTDVFSCLQIGDPIWEDERSKDLVIDPEKIQFIRLEANEFPYIKIDELKKDFILLPVDKFLIKTEDQENILIRLDGECDSLLKEFTFKENVAQKFIEELEISNQTLLVFPGKKYISGFTDDEVFVSFQEFDEKQRTFARHCYVKRPGIVFQYFPTLVVYPIPKV